MANRNDETPDPCVLACYDRAKVKARELGRWDADHAIFDLLAAEIPRELHGVIVRYLATEQWGAYLSGLSELGYTRRDELVCWGCDILRELGTWISRLSSAGPVYELSGFAPRWVPPVGPMSKAAPAPAPVKLSSTPTPGCGAIRVYAGGEIPAGMHWATAAGRGIISHVATYFAPLVDAFVCRAHVAEVERVHPGKWYVYL